MRTNFRLFFILLIILSSLAFSYEKRINCGGNDSLEINGEIWEPDRSYSSRGYGYVGGRSIECFKYTGGTDKFKIYFNQREAFREYKFNLPNGNYLIMLKMSEPVYHHFGKRLFNIIIEDSIVADDIDLYSFVEKDYSFPMVFFTNVTDSVLNIEFESSEGNSVLAGIIVSSLIPDTISPYPIEELRVYSSYNAIIVDWSKNFLNSNFVGYQVFRNTGSHRELLTEEPIFLSRYIDRDIRAEIDYSYSVIVTDLFGNESSEVYSPRMRMMEKGDTELPNYEIYISESNLQILDDDPYSDEYVIGDFRFNSSCWENIRARYRGGVSRKYSKKNFKVNFNSGDRFFGIDKLNFNGEYYDTTCMKNLLGLNLLSLSGIDAPTAKFANIWINDNFYGIAIEVEQVDEQYLENRGYSEDDYIYKNSFSNFNITEDITHNWEVETGAGLLDDYYYLREFRDIVHYTPDSKLKQTFDSLLVIENILKYYAVISLEDDYDFTIHNYYLHRQSDSGKWQIIPWDLNLAFNNSTRDIGLGSFYNPFKTMGGSNLFLTRIMGIREYRERYCELIDSLSYSLLDSEFIGVFIDSLIEYSRADLHADYRKIVHEDNLDGDLNISDFNRKVIERVEYVRTLTDDFREFNNPVNIFINELCIYNDSLISDEFGEFEPFLELYNAGDSIFDLGQLFLSNEPFNQSKWSLPCYLLGPGEFKIIWLDNEIADGNFHANFNPSDTCGFIGLFDSRKRQNTFRANFYLPCDLLFYEKFRSNFSWQRFPDGNDFWSFADPTPNTDNNRFVSELNIPNEIVISACPNPFNCSCKIIRPEYTAVDIFDIKGNLIQTLSENELYFNPSSDLSSGVFLIRQDGNAKSIKIVYIK